MTFLSQCCMGQWGPSVPWHMVHLNNNDIYDMIWYTTIFLCTNVSAIYVGPCGTYRHEESFTCKHQIDPGRFWVYICVYTCNLCISISPVFLRSTFLWHMRPWWQMHFPSMTVTIMSCRKPIRHPNMIAIVVLLYTAEVTVVLVLPLLEKGNIIK